MLQLLEPHSNAQKCDERAARVAFWINFLILQPNNLLVPGV